MNNFEADDMTLQKGVIEMITVANEYCNFIERAEYLDAAEIHGFFQKIAPLVYLRRSLLPEPEQSDEIGVGHFVTEEQWERVFNTLGHKFGKDDAFFLVDDNQEVVRVVLPKIFLVFTRI